MSLLLKLLSAGSVMGLLDFIWLGYVGKKFYHDEMGKILLAKPNMVAAILFYIVYIIGVIIFVVNPALAKDSLLYAAGYAVLFGLVCYATYDVTSLAVIKGFSTKIVIIDLLWGMLLTAVVSSVAFIVVSKWA